MSLEITDTEIRSKSNTLLFQIHDTGVVSFKGHIYLNPVEANQISIAFGNFAHNQWSFLIREPKKMITVTERSICMRDRAENKFEFSHGTLTAWSGKTLNIYNEDLDTLIEALQNYRDHGTFWPKREATP